MESLLLIASVSLLAFASTNLDNLLLLVGLLSRAEQPFWPICSGYLLATGAMLAVGLAASLAADFAPQRWVGYLGFVPLLLGARELHRMAFARPGGRVSPRASQPPVGVLAVAGVMLANSGDSIAVFVPLFAETQDPLTAAIVLVAIAGCVSWCALARSVAHHERLGPPIQRIGSRIVPFALIAIGLYVLSDTRTDTLLESRPLDRAPAAVASEHVDPDG